METLAKTCGNVNSEVCGINQSFVRTLKSVAKSKVYTNPEVCGQIKSLYEP